MIKSFLSFLDTEIGEEVKEGLKRLSLLSKSGLEEMTSENRSLRIIQNNSQFSDHSDFLS